MDDSADQIFHGEPDELHGLLDYVSGDPALERPQQAQMIVTYSRMIRLVSQLRRAQVELSASHGMHAGDFDILFLLQRAGKRQLRAKDIATILRVTPGGISKRIDRLVAAQLVRRETDNVDRRASVVILTTKGVELANSARALSRVESFNALNEQEWRQLDSYLKRMLESHARSLTG